MKSAKYWNDEYKNGKNISLLMREEKNIDYNSKDVIEMSYELQSGSYIEDMKNYKLSIYYQEYTLEIANIIKSLCQSNSILEAGIGEASTFYGVVNNLDNDVKCYGFDLSWSRIAYANKWLASNEMTKHSLCTGNLLDIPFLDNSIDVVYTSHSIEPNRGNEKEILKELFRITNKYLVLLEPAYELTNDENRARMDRHKYCKGLEKTAKELGYNVIKHELFKYNANPLNPTSLIIIEKNKHAKSNDLNVFACPKHKTTLIRNKDCYYSTEAMSIYPIVDNIPCLRVENSILAVKYEELF